MNQIIVSNSPSVVKVNSESSLPLDVIVGLASRRQQPNLPTYSRGQTVRQVKNCHISYLHIFQCATYTRLVIERSSVGNKELHDCQLQEKT